MTLGTIAGTIAIVLVTVALGVLLDRKYPLLRRPEALRVPRTPPAAAVHAAGEAPVTALRARAGQLARLRAQHCPGCRSAMTNADDDTVRYGGGELLVLRFRCPACAARRTLYIRPA